MTDVRTVAYGRPALDALAEVVAAAKRDDPMAPVTVVAPTTLAGTTLRRHLAQGVGGRLGIAGLEVTTLRRLADRLALPHLGARRPAVRSVVSAAVRAALAADPGPFAEVADHPGTVQALARAYAEIRELSDEQRAAVAATSPLVAAVIAIHDTVRRNLAPGFYDERDVLEAASRATAPTGACVAYLPQQWTPSEARFAASLDPTHVIVGATETERGDQEPFSTAGLSARTGNPPVATRVLTASDADDEVRSVVREVVARLATTPAHRIAVLYPSRVPYARLLHEQLDAAGIHANGPGVRPVEERSVARVLLGILDLADDDVPRADLFRALASAPTRDFTGQRIPLSSWERTSRSAGIVRGDDWETRVDAYVGDLRQRATQEAAGVEPRAWLVDRFGRDADAAQALETFGCRLRDELRGAARMTSWSALAGWARSLLGALVGDVAQMRMMPEDEKLAASAVVLMLEDLAHLDVVAPTTTFTAFRDVVRGELSAQVPRSGRFGDGILVAPIAAAVGLDLDVAYVVGLAEDIYPGRPHPDALLPDAARENAAGALRTPRQDLSRRFRDLLVAFASASEAVATFPRGDLRRSTVRLPSRWLLSSLRALTGDDTLAATGWEHADYRGRLISATSYAGALGAATSLSTDQEWRTRAAVAGVLEDATVTAAVELIRARASDSLTRFDGLLGAAEGRPDSATHNITVAPTTLEGYAACPHAFFVRRLLGVQPVEQPEETVTISPAESGNLVHQVMDRLVAGTGDLPRDGAPWTAEHRIRLAQLIAEAAEDFVARGLTGHARLWAGERTRIARDIQEMLDTDDAWRRERGASVVASELSFGVKGQPPVSIAVPGGRVLFRGSADKVDVGADRTVYVTDIKTGSTRPFKDIETDPFVGGTKLQLPVYAMAARERFGTEDTPVRADYWFVRKERTRIGLDVTGDKIAEYGDTVGTLVRSIAAGLFPAKAPDGPDFAWVQCDYCNPDGLGHSEVRDRYERKRTDPVLRDLVALIDPAATTP